MKDKGTPDCSETPTLNFDNTRLEGGRNERIDSIKGLLIILVVFGHFVFIGPTSFDNKAIYSFIYLFHMPLFVFLSGYYTRKKDNVSFKKGWFGLLEVFLAFSVYFFFFLFGFLNISIEYLMTPIWILWYLCTLLIYRLIFHFVDINRLNPIVVILLSFFIAVASGFVPWIDEKFAFNKTCTFLPYFVLGLYAQRYKDKFVDIQKIPQVLSFIVLALIFFLCEKYEDYFLTMVVTDGHNFYVGDYNVQPLFYLRIIYLAVSLLASICVLNMIPQMDVLSKCGRNSLKIYLFHAFPVWYLGILTSHFNYGISLATVITLTVLTVYLTNIISRYPISDIVIRPYTWLKRKQI